MQKIKNKYLKIIFFLKKCVFMVFLIKIFNFLFLIHQLKN